MATPRTGRPNGRPTLYRDEYEERAFQYSLLGATDEQMAGYFRVSVQTFNTWKKKHPGFLESLEKGKATADGKVAKALYQRALGYAQPAVKIFLGPGGKTIEHKYIERFPPDTAAAFIWLKNRQPELWRDKPETSEKDKSAKAGLDMLLDLMRKGPAAITAQPDNNDNKEPK